MRGEEIEKDSVDKKLYSCDRGQRAWRGGRHCGRLRAVVSGVRRDGQYAGLGADSCDSARAVFRAAAVSRAGHGSPAAQTLSGCGRRKRFMKS